MISTPYIAVEGPIGVGKTTLTRAIAQSFHYTCYEEVVEENPFLKAFYEDIEKASFQTEMFFLTHRFGQLEEIEQKHQAGLPIVSDYHIFKNKLFASQTLKPAHYKKFSAIYEILTSDLPKPNVLIYLEASLEELLKRIKRRNREQEEHLSVDYLKQLVASYEEWIPSFATKHPDVLLITIDTDHLNFADHPEDLQHTLTMIKERIQQGVLE
ncbi:deoxynucleoside kinase [Pullulanibacillus pueri]|uniref:Deoxyguanosine kinase n=1 Tax=Pullulanibacillus pueri TaxID=1437324 RepID=A0A8J2ZVQ2_9BACL|nr:deoxynucleoside kinase [Pullulanibacillus pueri]GGH80222.1 deoxyguanosine kinase [Pullulanibacillus pueri]